MPERQEKPMIPPPRKAVSEFLTPVPTVAFFSEVVNRDDPSYQENTPVKRGTLYSTIKGATQSVIDAYPNLYFIKESRMGVSDQWVIWTWATVPNAEDSYNAEIDYVTEAVAAPRFSRVYTIRRDTYEASPTIAPGTPLTGLVSVNITNPGSGFTAATGTIATGGKVQFVVANGQIIGGIVTDEGSAVVSGGAIVISGDGTGAAATARIQPASAVLVSQKKQEFPEDHPLRNEFVKVIRIYETLPGPFIATTRIDDDGAVVSVEKRRNIATNIASSENIIAGIWTKVTKNGDTDFVAEEVKETRPLPGNPMAKTQVADDGSEIDIVRTLKDTSTIVTGETLSGGIWTKTSKEAVSDLVAWEVVEAREIPGNAIPSANVEQDHEVASTTRTLKDTTAITPSATELAGVITTVEKKEVSDLVSEEIRTTKNWLDKAKYSVEIPDVIPTELRAQIPLITESHIIAGTASAPTLGTHEFERTEEQQTKLLFERRIVKIQDPTLPIVVTSKGLTTKFGGATTTITLTLDTHGSLTIDQGKMVLDSKVTDLGNGDDIKITEVGDGTDWPSLDSTHVDEKYALIVPITKQVVAAGATGGVSGGIYTEVRSLDKWRSISIASQIDTDNLPDDTQWFSGQRHSFPPELTDAIIKWAEATCGCSDSFSAMLEANFNQYTGMVKTRITEQFYNGPPPDDVVIDQFFPQAHNFGFAWASACGDSDGNCRTKSGAPLFHIPLCLHDDIDLSIGLLYTWHFDATTPAALPHGSYIMLPPHIERWRFGVFRRVLTEVLVP